MDEKHKTHMPTLEQGLWPSPVDSFSSLSNTGRPVEFMSTPNFSVLPSLSKRLEDSGESSKQDSGYCSLTPKSADSLGGIFEQKCKFCNKLSNLSYVVSTPECITCRCKERFFEHRSPHSEYLKNISETNVSTEQPIICRVKRGRSTELYDEAMDTSLYPDEMEVCSPGESLHCSLDTSEIGEEKSIDFIEENCLSLNSVRLKDIKEEQKINQEEGNVTKTKEYLCSIGKKLRSDGVSHKVRDKTSPIKFNNFLSVAKKISTLSRVIRSFPLNGMDEVDFLYQLGVKRNIPHVISKILSYLSEKDLNSVLHVSKTWNEIMKKDFAAFHRWQLSRVPRMWKENFTSPADHSGERQRTGPVSPLRVLNNQLSPTTSPRKKSPPVSPETARFHSFYKQGKTLKQGERLLPCPKCYFPSHDRGSPTVQCSRSGCRHRFCVWCRNEIVPGTHHDCPPFYTPRVRRTSHKVAPVGSKSSKRSLRRLL